MDAMQRHGGSGLRPRDRLSPAQAAERIAWICPFNGGMESRGPLSAMAIGILCAAACTQAVAVAASESVLAAARNKASSCLARDFDGLIFRDPYLTYVYPDEKLPAPASDPGLTYRAVDADIMLALLERERNVPTALRAAVKRADQVLRELPGAWRGRGFSNTRRGSRVDGVALDTFCIVGWLEGDKSMAEAAAQALDGDGWLPEGLYDGEERFRRDADEAWCLRLLASGSAGVPAPARRVLDRLVSDFRITRQEDPSGRQAFYAAYHLGLLLEDSQGLGEALDPAALSEELGQAINAWAAARPPGHEPASDILEWANLAASKLRYSGASDLRGRAVEILLRYQHEDGCWRVPGARPPEAGSSFLTLRALLALSS